MERRETFKDTMAEVDSAMNAAEELSNYIDWLNLPSKSHNEIYRLIENYVEECELGAYIKGAKEKPTISTTVNGQHGRVYNTQCGDCPHK